MAQVKIYGLSAHLSPIKEKLSNVLHHCLMDAFALPAEKKFHRFIFLEKDCFYFPDDRTEQYTIIEISLFEGRSIEAKKKLYALIFDRFQNELNIASNDVEITLSETPAYNWGIRGKAADELQLNYKVNV
jgi:phenylpyruvate tautomerase PptA (4-oxalocrotonate tautomerase family)